MESDNKTGSSAICIFTEESSNVILSISTNPLLLMTYHSPYWYFFSFDDFCQTTSALIAPIKVETVLECEKEGHKSLECEREGCKRKQNKGNCHNKYERMCWISPNDAN